MSVKITSYEWQERIDNVQTSHRYTILKLDYNKRASKIRCSLHGTFIGRVAPLAVEGRTSCPACKQIATNKAKHAKSLANLLEVLQTKFEGRITVSDTEEYRGVGTEIEFNCSLHGPFRRKPAFLTRESKYGCPTCMTESLKYDVEKVAKKRWYRALKSFTGDYTFGKYIDSKTELSVKCNVHGTVTKIIPNNHIVSSIERNRYKGGCSRCHGQLRSDSQVKPTSTYLKQLNKKHKGKVELVGGKYYGAKVHHVFKCGVCFNTWEASAESLVRTKFSGCPCCAFAGSTGSSKSEEELHEWVRRYFPDVVRNVRYTFSEVLGQRLEWDLYIPSKKIAIEFNGLYFHSSVRKPQNYHYEKSKCAEEYGAKLLHVYEDDWLTRKSVVKRTLKFLLGVETDRHFARKLRVVTRTSLPQSYHNFYNKNHMLGSPKNGVSYALVDDRNSLKAVMTFSKIRSERGTKSFNDYELVRFACKGHIVGGASRLFTAFLRDFNPSRVISYSDNDLFDGHTYEVLGFEFRSEIKPDYKTVWSGVRKHKSYSRRSNLAKLLGDKFDPTKSEMSNLLDNNVMVIYDAGKRKWEWNALKQSSPKTSVVADPAYKIAVGPHVMNPSIL